MLVEFDGNTFSTKKAFGAFVENQLYNEIGFGRYETGTVQYTFLCKLLERHPNYERISRKQIKAFSLEENLIQRGAIHAIIVYVDGENDAFSWRKCITAIQVNSEDRQRQRLIQAMREAISPDTMAFKRDSNQCCVLCQSTHNLHTDHSTISFKTISTDFLMNCVANSITIPKTFDCDNTSRCIFRQDDAAFTKQWYDYHKSKAVYQILCQTCNCKKGDK
jgi:hypothetical protein